MQRATADVDAAVERARVALTGCGERVTVGRLGVVRALAALGGHPDAEKVHAEVSRSSGTHRATTYRTLEHLVHLGLVTHLHAGHGPTRYHLSARVSGHDHLHAVCSGCGDVHDLAPDLLDAVAGELAGAGFRLDPRHVALSGRCEGC